LSQVRTILYGAATLMLAALTSPDMVRSALAVSASALFEATPFLLVSVALARLLPRRHHAAAYLGCGCSSGPSARSIPAVAATWLVFGPQIALARFAAAIFAARFIQRRLRQCADEDAFHLLGELAALLPAALLAAAAMEFFARFDPARLSPLGVTLVGIALGFGAAPCGLGAIAVAGALRLRAPLAAMAFLCVAGIVDFRALASRAQRCCNHDACAYALLAVSLSVVAWRHGDALVHPAIAVALAICAPVAFLYAIIYRRQACTPARVAPSLMLIGALVGAPPPAYYATETTLADLFPGERLTFTGVLTRQGRSCALVRYAITCCRADAAPIAVRLDRTPSYPAGTWLRVKGQIESLRGDLRLDPQQVERIAPPSDPFVYR
jgi:hypothetical protein